eukprot:3703482-Amphidinium_carterae.2
MRQPSEIRTVHNVVHNAPQGGRVETIAHIVCNTFVQSACTRCTLGYGQWLQLPSAQVRTMDKVDIQTLPRK